MNYENIADQYSKKRHIPLQESLDLHEKLETFFKNVVSSPVPLSPTEDVDDVWHHFILNTKEYEQYCLSKFGKFIHHTPMETPEGFADCSASCKGH